MGYENYGELFRITNRSNQKIASRNLLSQWFLEGKACDFLMLHLKTASATEQVEP
jgi:hypothetical protein